MGACKARSQSVDEVTHQRSLIGPPLTVGELVVVVEGAGQVVFDPVPETAQTGEHTGQGAVVVRVGTNVVDEVVGALKSQRTLDLAGVGDRVDVAAEDNVEIFAPERFQPPEGRFGVRIATGRGTQLDDAVAIHVVQ